MNFLYIKVIFKKKLYFEPRIFTKKVSLGNFIKDNESFFRKQYRLAMLTRNLDKMSDEKLNNHLKTADKFLRDIQ